MPFQDFDAARREAVNEPVAFTLRGERFDCRDTVPLRVVLLYAIAGGSAIAAYQFIAAAMDDGDFDRFAKVVDHAVPPILTDEAVGIADWLQGVYTGRPTRPSTGSPAGRSTTGPSSKEPSPKGKRRKGTSST